MTSILLANAIQTNTNCTVEQLTLFVKDRRIDLKETIRGAKFMYSDLVIVSQIIDL